MSTQANATTTVAPNVSTLQKIENWFHKAKVAVEADVAKILGPTLASQVESAFGGILATAEGKLALTVVTEAADVTTGQVDIAKAVSATVTAVASTGKTISQSAATLLVAAAQQKVLSIAQPSS